MSGRRCGGASSSASPKWGASFIPKHPLSYAVGSPILSADFLLAEMNMSLQRRSVSKGARPQSLFYRDLSASPATRSSPSKGELGTLGKAAAAASWKENLGGIEHPPPPILSLEEWIDRSPDAGFGESLVRSLDSKFEEAKSPTRTPLSNLASRTPVALAHGDTGHGFLFGSPTLQNSQQYKTPASPNWWSPLNEGRSPDFMVGRDLEKVGGSPVSGVVQQPQQSGGLLTLPTIREIVRPEYQLNGTTSENNGDGDEWVTVFGFGAEETNAVMREFEKCGTILRHVPGPGGANWIHIQFQDKLDAQKAHYKNGMQINGALIVGVKPLDPLQRQALTEKSQRMVFNVLPPKTQGQGTLMASGKASARPYYLQPSGGSRTAGPIASPAKSKFSKIVDFVFGL